MESSTFLLLVIIGMVAWGMYFPFAPADSWIQVKDRIQLQIADWDEEPILRTLAERGLSFLPIGGLLYWRAADRRRPAMRAALSVMVTAVVLEAGQALLSNRHPRLPDVILAIGFGSVGVWIGALAAGYRHALCRRHPDYERHAARVAVVAGNLLLAGAVIGSHSGLRLEGWASDYPLLVANEATGDRPWLGRIGGFALYPRALSPKEIRELARLPIRTDSISFRRNAGAAVLYTFDEVDTGRVPEQISGAPPLDLFLPDSDSGTWVPCEDGIDITRPTTIRTVGDLSTIAELLDGSDALTIEVEAGAADLNPASMGRIVSCSRSPSLRNFTVGQTEDRVDFRVRTPRTGDNGTEFIWHKRPQMFKHECQSVICTYADGVMRVYMSGLETCSPLHLYRMSVLILRRDNVFSRILAGLILLVPMGFAAGCMLRTQPAMRTWLFGLCVGVMPLAAMTIAASCLTRRAHDGVFLVSGLVGCSLGLALPKRGPAPDVIDA